MTTFHLRTGSEQPLPKAADAILLDWFGGPLRQRSTIAATTELLLGLAPTPAARDLFAVGGAVYCIDKLAIRSVTADAWTRTLEVHAPVAAPARWQAAQATLGDALGFLSGDHWRLRFSGGGAKVRGKTHARRPDAVSLFSGGLDSLGGAIDLLEDGRDVMLVGHFEGGFIGGVQMTLFEQLRRAYSDRVRLRQLRLGPAAPNRLQARPLPHELREITTRARSFLFIAAGIAVANAFGDDVPLFMPENGFIGINVPLVGSRVGSLSTRTTHPYFVARLVEVLDAVGVANPLLNPFRLKTKGEALADCRNPDLLAVLVDKSISCSHPESARWDSLPSSNCGYCYPCLIRRAALHRIALDSAASYRHDALTEDELLDEESDRGADLRALVRGLARDPRPNDVLRNGTVPPADAGAFANVYMRGRAELTAWLRSGTGTALRRRLAGRAAG